jgi:hypothetical protein
VRSSQSRAEGDGFQQEIGDRDGSEGGEAVDEPRRLPQKDQTPSISLKNESVRHTADGWRPLLDFRAKRSGAVFGRALHNALALAMLKH